MKWHGSPYNKDSFKRIVSLSDDENMQRRWKCFLKTVKVDTLEFPFVIAKIRIFLETLFDALVNDNNQYCVNWYAKNRSWIN